jgi:DNA-binding transcriptional regulator YiaG
VHAELHEVFWTAARRRPILVGMRRKTIKTKKVAAKRSLASRTVRSAGVHRGRSTAALESGLERAASSSPSSLAELRAAFGLTRDRFSRLAGFSVRSLAAWEAGMQAPGDQARLRLSELERLREHLTKVIGKKSLASWLESPNDAFDGLKPLEVVERGHVDRLWRMIFLLESGAAS